ncbi:MAG: hypothetical protein FD180_4849 [Planctomycetota bacterium]|nr:MAG: hypothetical protein FD180_4849 [Planctomycetota bacterium]
MIAKAWLAGAAAVAALGTGALVASRFPAPKADAACCYFAAQEKDINQPGQKAFIAWDEERKVEAFTVQPKFEGNAVDFGMVIPTPSQPKLDEMPRDFFKDLAIYTILMPLPDGIWEMGGSRRARGGLKSGGGAGALGLEDKKNDGHGVKVLEAGVVGSLDYKIIVAEQANGLYDWLKENQYVYSGDKGTLDFYITKKWFFTVMKIDPKQMKKGAKGEYSGEVTPTRFTFASAKCIYPLRITALSVKDQTDALFYVQSAKQMDLEGDLSWMHSYRVMWLTYMLGCSANADQQAELQQRTDWVNQKKAKDPRYETTKLEWAKKLGDGELSVVEDPLKNYGQMGLGALPDGHKVVTIDELVESYKEEVKKAKGNPDDDNTKIVIKSMRERYDAAKGSIVKVKDPDKSFNGASYEWYANREAPAEDVKGLSRLKGHLQKGQWVTKFRKILRKDEMTDDLVLVAVPAGKEEEYVRIMPTSPP